MVRQRITLTNGKKVANFSSPHSFRFEDGSVLPAITNDDSDRLKVTFNEREVGDRGDVELTFVLSAAVWHEVAYWQKQHLINKVDVVFCPLPMINALYAAGYDVQHSPFRSIRVIDRISKLISITKQCL